MTGQAETIRGCVAMLARLPIGISLKDWSDVSGNLLDAAAHIDRLEAINAELLEGAKDAIAILDLAIDSWSVAVPHKPDEVFTDLQSRFRAAIASAQRIIGEGE